METVVIITGHGDYATKLEKTIESIVGENDQVHYVDFLTSDTFETLKEKYQAIIDKNLESKFLFICDSLGGIPYIVASVLEYENRNVDIDYGYGTAVLISLIVDKDKGKKYKLKNF